MAVRVVRVDLGLQREGVRCSRRDPADSVWAPWKNPYADPSAQATESPRINHTLRFSNA
jgi:hypothetical protein